ncbi:cytochrome ubiquinol oxidase subunit I [Domibacillus indicus]|uniref:cytochrome ubiquinol oxidase subunit I n=1 Tax=Domibacillus indicus TaxID=1437523 RepID=UPI0006180063|nr:cytochrome ubiquinol oxidase subunit I [Domibacillus indicus]
MELDGVMLSRMLTTMTLMFHVIFATIGVGVPVMISFAEFLGIKRNDHHYLVLARRWTRGYTITVAVGVVTGTIIGLQLSLLWPSFMEVGGKVIALPLFMETFAFFFEAIFLGIYLYTWDRFKNKWTHWLLTLPILLGSTASAFFITTVNAFMNTPRGFEIQNGETINVDPVAAMLNPAMPSKVFHVVASSYMTSAAILAAIAAFAILKGRRGHYQQKALRLTAACTFVFSLLTAFAGDVSAKFLADAQPEKLAAAEWHFETEKGADLVYFGTVNEDGEVENALRFPKLLSFLAGGSFDTEVIGLNDIPEDERPPLWIHYMFDTMVTIGMYVMAVTLLFVLMDRAKRRNALSKPLLLGILAAGPLSMIAIEAGWVLAETGRQPWIMRGYLKVAEAATTNDSIAMVFILFALLYLVLGIMTAVILIKMFKNSPAELEIEKRYPNRE